MTHSTRRLGRHALGRLVGLLLVAGCTPATDAPMPPSDAPPIRLSVAFQDGFHDDTVVARLGDREVFRQEGVTTDARIGLATSFEVDVEAAPATLDVEIPTQGVREAIPIEAGGPRHLGVSVEGGEVRLRWSVQPFGYL